MVAVLNLIAVAGRRKLAELRRIATIVGGAVTAHLMQHDDAVVIQAVGIVIQPVQQHVVEARSPLAPVVQLPQRHIGMRHAVAGAFAAAVVFAPQHADARVAEDIQHAVLMMRQISVVVSARHIREHAGHRDGGFSAAGGRLRIVDDILLFQLRVSFARVTAQRKVFRARGFADDQHHQRFFLLRRDGGALMRVLPDMHPGLAASHPAIIDVVADAADDIGRRDHFDQPFVIADQRGVIFIEEQRHQQDNPQRRRHKQRAPGEIHPPAFATFEARQEYDEGRRHAHQQQPDDGVAAEQRDGLLQIGFKDVLHHIGIDNGAEAKHNVVCRRARQDQHRQQRLAQERPGDQIKDQAERRRQHKGQAGGKEVVVQGCIRNAFPGAEQKQTVQDQREEQGNRQIKAVFVTL